MTSPGCSHNEKMQPHIMQVKSDNKRGTKLH